MSAISFLSTVGVMSAYKTTRCPDVKMPRCQNDKIHGKFLRVFFEICKKLFFVQPKFAQLENACYHDYMNDRTKKERNIDRLVAYLKTNPNTTYAQAAKVMHKSPRTIYNWCKERDTKLSTSSATSQPFPSYNFTVPPTPVQPRTRSQTHSSMDDVGRALDNAFRLLELKDMLQANAEAHNPPPESFEMYQARLNFESKRAHRQAKDKMLESIMLPMGDYLAQLLIQLFGGSQKR